MVSQIKVNEIIKQSGSSITIGESGDTITLPSTATLSNFPDNTPAFLLLSSGNTTISDNTWTKLTFATETLDTDSACTDSKFTVPSGKSGYYQISFSMNMGGATDGNGNYVQYKLYKNGSEQTGFGVSFNSSGSPTIIEEMDLCFSGIINLAATDYLEVYGRMDVPSGSVTTNTGHFCGIKVIGA